MTENIKLLLKIEGKKKSLNTYIAIIFNLILLVLLVSESLNTYPNINSYFLFTDYITYKVYQLFAIFITSFALISVSSIKDIRNYRFLLSYPIRYHELFAFIKIRKLKNFILTFFVNLVAIFYIGIKFDQNLKFFIVFLLGFITIALTCYLISDILSFTLYSIFPSDLFITFISAILLSPIMVVINSVKAGELLYFHHANKTYLTILDNIYPYCKFTYQIIFSGSNPSYSIKAMLITLFNLLLLALLYQILIKSVFFKVLEKEDSKKTRYSNIKIDNIRPQSSLIASLLKESRFLFRENKRLIFNIQVLIIMGLLLTWGFFYITYGVVYSQDIDVLSLIDDIKKSAILLPLAIYIASLGVDLINLTLNSGRIGIGQKYFSFDKYIQLNPRNTIYSILLIRLVISFSYYLLFAALLYVFKLLDYMELWIFIACLSNVITVASFDLIVDIKIPNLYTKMKLSNFLFDMAKPVVIILFKLLHLLTFFIILSYLIHNIYISILINNLLFLLPTILYVNSKYTLNSYNSISYTQ